MEGFSEEFRSVVDSMADKFNDPDIIFELQEGLVGKEHTDEVAAGVLADIIERKYLLVHQMEASIVGTMTNLGLTEGAVFTGDGAPDYAINDATVATDAAKLGPVMDLVALLRRVQAGEFTDDGEDHAESTELPLDPNGSTSS